MLAQNKNEKIYVALSYELLVDEMKLSCSYRRFVRCEVLEVEESELFEFIKDLMNAFFEILFDSFNIYDQVEHAIDLKDG